MSFNKTKNKEKEEEDKKETPKIVSSKFNFLGNKTKRTFR